MTRRPLFNFYVASCETDGGVYEYHLFEDGSVDLVRRMACPSPMYLARDGENLIALLRAPFGDNNESGVLTFNEKSGEQVGDVISTCGEVGCHIAVNDGDVFCANYISGSVSLVGKRTVTHGGGGIHPKRQTSSHPHSVVLSPDRKYLFTADLGTDKIRVYSRELDFIAETSVTPGSGARHICFSRCGRYLYCIGEMGANISVFSCNGASLNLLNTVDLLKKRDSDGSGAAIKLSSDGKRIYATERRECEVIILSCEEEKIREVSRFSSGGKEPRDIIELGGKFLIVANQWSDTVTVFSLSVCGAKRINSFSLKSPIALLEKQPQ